MLGIYCTLDVYKIFERYLVIRVYSLEGKFVDKGINFLWKSGVEGLLGGNRRVGCIGREDVFKEVGF